MRERPQSIRKKPKAGVKGTGRSPEERSMAFFKGIVGDFFYYKC
jgi:hypothetical protein